MWKSLLCVVVFIRRRKVDLHFFKSSVNSREKIFLIPKEKKRKISNDGGGFPFLLCSRKKKNDSLTFKKKTFLKNRLLLALFVSGILQHFF